jgi:hypothetical protein
LSGTHRRKAFFSEEKKQKTFMSLSRFYPAAFRQEQSFLGSFFQKKSAFLLANAIYLAAWLVIALHL